MGKIKENLLTVITSIMCMIFLFGCTSIDSKAESPATKSYTVDLRNGRVISGRGAFHDGDTLSKDEKDEIMLEVALTYYEIDVHGNKNNGIWHGWQLTSKTPYQGIEYDSFGEVSDIYAAKDAVGTGIYVVNKEKILQIKGLTEEDINGTLNAVDDIIEGSNVFYPEAGKDNNITYIIEVKYSDMPLVARYNVNGSCTVSFEAGHEFEYNGIKYRAIDTSGNVSAIGLTKKSRKVTIPDTVEPLGCKMNVTGIAKDFMKGDKKATSVTIGANVTSIGKQAFYKCKKLKKVTIRSTKLKSVGKKAFGKNAKKFAVKMPKSKRKAYKKLFKKAKVKI